MDLIGTVIWSGRKTRRGREEFGSLSFCVPLLLDSLSFSCACSGTVRSVTRRLFPDRLKEKNDAVKERRSSSKNRKDREIRSHHDGGDCHDGFHVAVNCVTRHDLSSSCFHWFFAEKIQRERERGRSVPICVVWVLRVPAVLLLLLMRTRLSCAYYDVGVGVCWVRGRRFLRLAVSCLSVKRVWMSVTKFLPSLGIRLLPLRRPPVEANLRRKERVFEKVGAEKSSESADRTRHRRQHPHLLLLAVLLALLVFFNCQGAVPYHLVHLPLCRV